MTRWAHWSLRRTLLVVLLPGLLAVMGLEIVVSWRNALAAANAAFDRSLLGAIKAMDANISTASGGLSVELPYRMLEFFELTASGQVFYRVASGDGLVEIGDALLPAPPAPGRRRAPVPRRRLLRHPRARGHLRAPAGPPAVARLALQPRHHPGGRNAGKPPDFTRRLGNRWPAMILLLAARWRWWCWPCMPACAPAAPAHRRGPAPQRRPHPHPRGPGAAGSAAAGGRHQPAHPALPAGLYDRRQFIDDASHQLRTLLTTLATQVGFALRETDPAHRELAPQAIKTQVDDAIRQDQPDARSGPRRCAGNAGRTPDLHALAERVTRRLWPLARQQGIDLGWNHWAPSPRRPGAMGHCSKKPHQPAATRSSTRPRRSG